jgi:hypothetical protein
MEGRETPETPAFLKTVKTSDMDNTTTGTTTTTTATTTNTIVAMDLRDIAAVINANDAAHVLPYLFVYRFLAASCGFNTLYVETGILAVAIVIIHRHLITYFRK